MAKQSKYCTDERLIHQVELMCSGLTTKEKAAEAMGFKTVAILNTVLSRTGFNERLKAAGYKTPRGDSSDKPRGRTEHLYKSTLTPEQLSRLSEAVSKSVGLNKSSRLNKKSVWKSQAEDIVGYEYFCALVKKKELDEKPKPPQTT